MKVNTTYSLLTPGTLADVILDYARNLPRYPVLVYEELDSVGLWLAMADREYRLQVMFYVALSITDANVMKVYRYLAHRIACEMADEPTPDEWDMAAAMGDLGALCGADLETAA